jgi:hypothetical protein
MRKTGEKGKKPTPMLRQPADPDLKNYAQGLDWFTGAAITQGDARAAHNAQKNGQAQITPKAPAARTPAPGRQGRGGKKR